MKEKRDRKDVIGSFVIPMIVMTIAPFVAIPVIVILLNFLIWIFSLPMLNELIVLKVDMESVISIGDFIYYYSTFLGIEITAYLSYRVFVLTVMRYDYEDKEKFEKNKQQLIIELRTIRQKIIDDTALYFEERGISKWSFYKKLEVEPKKQFSYSSLEGEFDRKISAKELYQIEGINDYIEDSNEEIEQLIKEIYHIYMGLEIIKKGNDISLIDVSFFHEYKTKILNVLKILDSFADNLK